MNLDREVTSYLPVLRSVPVFALNTVEGLTGAVPLCDRAGCDTVEGLAGLLPSFGRAGRDTVEGLAGLVGLRFFGG